MIVGLKQLPQLIWLVLVIHLDKLRVSFSQPWVFSSYRYTGFFSWLAWNNQSVNICLLITRLCSPYLRERKPQYRRQLTSQSSIPTVGSPSSCRAILNCNRRYASWGSWKAQSHSAHRLRKANTIPDRKYSDYSRTCTCLSECRECSPLQMSAQQTTSSHSKRQTHCKLWSSHLSWFLSRVNLFSFL